MIELDIGAIEIRYQQLQDCIKNSEECCKRLTGNLTDVLKYYENNTKR